MSSVSVVIQATDDPSTLPACRAALAASMDPAHEVIVVDRPASLSASDARNAGALRATGDVLVFVDADVEVHADALGRIRAAFAQDPRLTALHGSYDDSPRAKGTISVFRNLLHHHVHQTGGGPAETFWSGLRAVTCLKWRWRADGLIPTCTALSQVRGRRSHTIKPTIAAPMQAPDPRSWTTSTVR